MTLLSEFSGNVLDYECPTCGASVDQWCVTKTGRRAYSFHRDRLRLAVSSISRSLSSLSITPSLS